MVHAIGAGCLLLEVQEPSDFTVQPERWCGDYKLSDNEMYLGLDKDTAMECFDIAKKYPAPLEPVTISDKDGVKYLSFPKAMEKSRATDTKRQSKRAITS